MRIIVLTLALLAAAAAWAGQTPASQPPPGLEPARQELAEQKPAGQAQETPVPITGAFGVTLGEPLPLSSKQVLAVNPPGPGLVRYRLLFTPASRPPYAYHFATVAKNTKRVAAMTAQTRRFSTQHKALQAFLEQMEKLESTYGAGMRLGGGNIWKLKRQTNSITLVLTPAARTISLRLADERRMGLCSRPASAP